MKLYKDHYYSDIFNNVVAFTCVCYTQMNIYKIIIYIY